MPPSQIHTIIHDHVASLLQTGINPFEAEAIISTYHNQLNTLGLFNAAASLRRLAYPVYPAVYDSALKDTQFNLLCTNCKSPINNPRDKTRCETCSARTAPCPICNCKTPIHEPAPNRKPKSRRPSATKGVQFDVTTTAAPLSRPSILPPPAPPLASPSDPPPASSTSSPIHPTPLAPPPTLWTACPVCGHGGHSACIAAWFADPAFSDGACPTMGCLCDCVVGPRRARRLRGLEAEKAERDKARVVRGDEWRVQESRAVVGVRGSLGGAASAAASLAVSGEQSPGGRKEDGRRVRLVEPGGGGSGKKG